MKYKNGVVEKQAQVWCKLSSWFKRAQQITRMPREKYLFKENVGEKMILF